MGIRAVKRRAVFLDRDGVLNRVIVREGGPTPPNGIAELEILPGVAEALTALRAAGFVLVVVTNQPDVARGTLRREDVESVNRELTAHLPLDDVRVCYHDDADRCGCRKPEPGLLVDAAQDWDIDLGASFMVGDRWRDIDAGKRAGCTTILVDSRYPEDRRSVPDCSAASLHEASKWILARQTLTTS